MTSLAPRNTQIRSSLMTSYNGTHNINSDKRLIVTYPGSMSTPLSRAFSHATEQQMIHEVVTPEINATLKLLHPQEQDDIDSAHPELDNSFGARGYYKILKEMAGFSAENSSLTSIPPEGLKDAQEAYAKVLKDISTQSKFPIVLLTGNPVEIFCSIMRASFKGLDEEDIISTTDLSEQTQNSLATLKDNFNGMKKFRSFLQSKNIPFIELTKDEVRSNPLDAIQKMADAWQLPIVHKDLGLAKVVENYEDHTAELAQIPHYRLAHDDDWVSYAERDETHFRPSSKTENVEIWKEKLFSAIHKQSAGEISKSEADEIIKPALDEAKRMAENS